MDEGGLFGGIFGGLIAWLFAVGVGALLTVVGLDSGALERASAPVFVSVEAVSSRVPDPALSTLALLGFGL